MNSRCLLLNAVLLSVLVVLAVLGGTANSIAQTKAAPSRGATDAATKEKIVRYVRERFNIPAGASVTVGAFRASNYADFYVTTITVDQGGQKRGQDFFVSKDGRYLIEGNIFTLGADPKREIRSQISLQGQASEGPANAPVTIVEYSDLQCPMCARAHQFLVSELMPKYAGKVRIIYKEFPLVNIHEWSLAGAVANQCVYQLNPSLYSAYRTLLFEESTTINATNARDRLLAAGEQLGLDRLKLAACIDSRASMPRIEQHLREANALGLNSTPTFFVNGKIIVGMADPQTIYKAIDEALREAKQ